MCTILVAVISSSLYYLIILPIYRGCHTYWLRTGHRTWEERDWCFNGWRGGKSLNMSLVMLMTILLRTPSILGSTKDPGAQKPSPQWYPLCLKSDSLVVYVSSIVLVTMHLCFYGYLTIRLYSYFIIHCLNYPSMHPFIQFTVISCIHSLSHRVAHTSIQVIHPSIRFSTIHYMHSLFYRWTRCYLYQLDESKERTSSTLWMWPLVPTSRGQPYESLIFQAHSSLQTLVLSWFR